MLFVLLVQTGALAQPSEPATGAPAWSSTTTAGPDHATWADVPVDGATSSLDVTENPAAPATLATELEKSPSVTVRRTGGPSSPAWMSIRGSEPWHVRVLLEGVPLNGALTSSFDLSSLPLSMLERVDVYRSNVPLWLSAPLPGGLVDLQLRDDPSRWTAAAGAGAFGFRRLNGAAGWTRRSRSTLLGASVSGTDGDFRYFNDNGTPLNLQDDRESRRLNNADRQWGAHAAHQLSVARWHLRLLALATSDRRGVPGYATVQSEQTSLDQWRGLVAMTADRRRLLNDHLDLQLVANAGREFNRYQDPLAERGLQATDLTQTATTVGAAVRPSWWLSPDRGLRQVLEVRHEQATFRSGVADAPQNLQSATRTVASAGLEPELWALQQRLHVRAGVRVDHHVDSAVGQPVLVDAQSTVVRTQWSPQVGVGLRIVTTDTWAADGLVSAGLASRAPSFFELYGAEGTVVGNPGLRSERRAGGDAGLRAGSTDGDVGWQVHYTFFDRRVDDLIVMAENGQGVAIPRNLQSAAIRGHELEAMIGWRQHLSVRGHYTLMDALQRSPDPTLQGQRLPWRSVHSGFVELTGSLHWFAASWQLDAASDWYLDEREQRPIPARVLQNASVLVRPPLAGAPQLELTVQNLTDQRVQSVEIPDGGQGVRVPRAIADFGGFPLPGRSVFVTLSFSGATGPRSDRSTEP
jgi:iron complex outermembrane receptor protein